MPFEGSEKTHKKKPPRCTTLHPSKMAQSEKTKPQFSRIIPISPQNMGGTSPDSLVGFRKMPRPPALCLIDSVCFLINLAQFSTWRTPQDWVARHLAVNFLEKFSKTCGLFFEMEIHRECRPRRSLEMAGWPSANFLIDTSISSVNRLRPQGPFETPGFPGQGTVTT